MSSAIRALLLVALACAHASAQPELDAPPPSPDQSAAQEGVEGTTIVPERFDPARCMARTKSDAEPEPANVAPPVTWSGFDIEGQLADERTTVRALFEPTMSRHRALTSAAREDVRAIAEAFGYHLVGLTPREVPGNGTVAIIHLAPLPMLRRGAGGGEGQHDGGHAGGCFAGGVGDLHDVDGTRRSPSGRRGPGKGSVKVPVPGCGPVERCTT